MRPDTYRPRELRFAYVFGPPRLLDRRVAMKVHDALCRELSLEDMSFRFSPAKPDDGKQEFSISIDRKEGRGGLAVLLEGKTGQPLRLLVKQAWPQNHKQFEDRMDMIAKALWTVLSQNWDVIIVEARILGQCSSGRTHAAEFFADGVFGFRQKAVSGLGGEVSFAGMTLVTMPTSDGGILERVGHEIKLEILVEDPGDVYVEAMSQWSLVPGTLASRGTSRPAQPAAFIVSPEDARVLRDRRPSEFIQDASGFLQEKVLNLFSADQGAR